MRHGVSLLASLEGMSRSAYRIARELSANSRSGLTVRFLSKKLEMPTEEIEYLLDLNHRLIFLDLTKVKLVPEGHTLIKRISDGLENHGDVPSLFRRMKQLTPHEFRWLEERLDAEEPLSKKAAAETLLERCYKHPDSIVSYVATRPFSETAREVFDLVLQSKDGILPVSQIRIGHGASEYVVEQALLELFNGCALFELFRFDAEDRLVRVAGLLSELRQYREQQSANEKKPVRLKPARLKPDIVQQNALGLSDAICQLVAAIAARPARLRGDGDLFREDRRRLGEIRSEEDEPSLSTCLWIAEGVGWLVRIDNTLRAGELEHLLPLDRLSRHQILAEWLMGRGDDSTSRHVLTGLLDDLRADTWYSTIEFVQFAMRAGAENEQPVLKASGAHWSYLSPSVSGSVQSRLARSLEETFCWLGIVDRGEAEGESLFRMTPLGAALLLREIPNSLREGFARRKGEFVVQPNFDVVVPTQDMDPLLTVPLDTFAVRLSTGQATVYNLRKETFTQAVQEGHDANRFVQFLLAHNREENLPRNVMMTLEDWRGGMKRVRLRTIHVLETDDPLISADLMHRRRLSKYFRNIDPNATMRYVEISRSALAKALEKDGFIVE